MKEPSVIDTIVKYSKDCIVMRFIKKHMKTSLRLGKSLPSPFILPSIDNIQEVINELQMRIDERESDIGKLLIPLFEGNDFGYKPRGKYSLTIKEMKEGYLILPKEKHIILLRPMDANGFHYNPGVLYKIGSGVRLQDLYKIQMLKGDLANTLFDSSINLIINNKDKYEYLKRIEGS